MSTVTEDEFRELCKKHDLTYEYSDDHHYWTQGNASLAKVQAAAKQLPREVVVRIWNEVVDTKLVPDARAQFYWKV
jgi:hypothetical protein